MTKIISTKHVSAGDAAVSGLFSGLLAGIVMGLYLVFAGLLAGQGVAGYLAYFGLGKAVTPLAGLMLHLAISGIYGIIFGVVRHWVGLDRRQAVPRWLVGLVYGLITWVLAVYLILPGLGSSLNQIPTLHFVLAHAVFGLVLGIQQKP
jgi:hypothetical protein